MDGKSKYRVSDVRPTTEEGSRVWDQMGDRLTARRILVVILQAIDEKAVGKNLLALKGQLPESMAVCEKALTPVYELVGLPGKKKGKYKKLVAWCVEHLELRRLLDISATPILSNSSHQAARDAFNEGVIRQHALVSCTIELDRGRPIRVGAKVIGLVNPDSGERKVIQAPLRIRTVFGAVAEVSKYPAKVLPSGWVEAQWREDYSRDPVWGQLQQHAAWVFVEEVTRVVKRAEAICVVTRVFQTGEFEVSCEMYDNYLHAEFPRLKRFEASFPGLVEYHGLVLEYLSDEEVCKFINGDRFLPKGSLTFSSQSLYAPDPGWDCGLDPDALYRVITGLIERRRLEIGRRRREIKQREANVTDAENP